MSQYLSPLTGRQWGDANGNPYSGAKLFTYEAGTSTKFTVTKDQAGASNHTNPIILNSRGEPADGAGTTQAIWQASGQEVKYVLAPANDTDPPVSPYWTIDDVSGINDTSVTATEWITGPTPTYVSATQFTLVGDQTSTFHVGRRLKTTNSGGTIYSTITVSAYTTLTTITVVNDSGSLDSGISNVSYGIISASNTSVPGVKISGSNWTHQGTVTHQGNVTMSGKSVIDANASVAAHATTSDIWSTGNYVTLTGAVVTFTDFADAPQAGAEAELYCNDAHVFTHNANLLIDGSANFTAAAGDRILVRAKSTTVFTLHPRRISGISTITLGPDIQTFTSSGTWTKPSGYSANCQVRIEAWGGGGSGGGSNAAAQPSGGGGGGAYNERWTTLSVLGATETITIGAGGAAIVATSADGNAGGNTTVGTLLTAYGGGGGAFNAVGGGGGGGGGGLTSAGTTATISTGSAGGGNTFTTDTYWDGGTGGDAGNPPTAGAASMYGGGGGGGADTTGQNTGGVGGNSLYGGAGGGGGGEATGGASGGTSTYGGNGGAGSADGAVATSGSQPGGGGGGTESSGTSGAGGAGKVIITVFA